jgi:hypothetical protein
VLHGLLGNLSLHPEISKNPSASPSILWAIWVNQRNQSPHIDYATKLSLAQNPSTPEALLRELYVLGEAKIWERLAQNSSCPEKLLRFFEILLEPSWLALNPAISMEWLARLAASPDDKTRRNAAKNPSVTIECLTALAQGSRVEVRRQVAARPDLPAALQILLALDHDPSVQKALSRTRTRQERVLRTYPKK